MTTQHGLTQGQRQEAASRLGLHTTNGHLPTSEEIFQELAARMERQGITFPDAADPSLQALLDLIDHNLEQEEATLAPPTIQQRNRPRRNYTLVNGLTGLIWIVVIFLILAIGLMLYKPELTPVINNVLGLVLFL